MPTSVVKRILQAQVYDVAIKSALDKAENMSSRLNNSVYLKREDQQPVFSFKIRGAYNRMVRLSNEERAKGIIAASAGNHAQGVALAAKELGIEAIIVMPKTTPQIKVDAVRARGGNVVLVGDSYDDASAHAKGLVADKGMTYIHPYDDLDVIAGQGTVAMEICQQHSGPIDAVFIPVGGGGLAAGMASYFKYVRPETKVIAVEPEDAACLKAAMDANERVVLPEVGIFADGVAVKQIGEETFRILSQTVDDVITVTTDEICAAVKDTFDATRVISEPAGAVGLAGLKKYVEATGCEGKSLVAVSSGANTNFDRLRYISERTTIGERREAILCVTIPEKPGAFKAFCSAIGPRMVTEFNYRYSSAGDAHIFVGVQVSPDNNDADNLIASLTAQGYTVQDFTDNEMAKIHVRHMVGGHHPGIENERLLRFEFPERPGALAEFLSSLGSDWNISLFHYRNHGAAYGRVLAGLQVPEQEVPALYDAMRRLGYSFKDETENPAYRLFLA